MMLTYADDDALEEWTKRQQARKGKPTSFTSLVFESSHLFVRRQAARLGGALVQYLPGVPDSKDQQRAQTTADSSRHERG